MDPSSQSLVPTPEQSRVAAQQYEKARQAITSGNLDYGIDLLQTCCKIDPGNLVYRKALRQTARHKFKNNQRGSSLAWLTNTGAKTRMLRAKRSGDPRLVLEVGEEVLARNPWDVATQLDMAEAADELGLGEMAVWIAEQARDKDPKDIHVNRALARLYERHGMYTQAIAMWELVHKADPKDVEAAHKGKELAATNTIVRGQYDKKVKGGADSSAAVDAGSNPEIKAASSAADTHLARQAEPLRSRINQDPANPINYLRLYELYHRADRFDEAHEVLEDGLRATGQNFDLLMAMAELEIEPFRQNLRVTEEKLVRSPKDENLIRMRAWLNKEINSRELTLYRQRADRFPSDMGPRLELGIRLLRSGQLDEAIQELQQCRRDPRHRARTLLYLGHCFKGKNNWTLAKRNFEESLQALPPEEEDARKEILYELAKGAALERDWKTAIELGNELANLDYTYRDIGPLLDEWQQQLTRSPGAARS